MVTDQTIEYDEDFDPERYRHYYISGEPVLPCPRHRIIAIAADSEGPFIFGCPVCTIRYALLEALVS